MKRLAFLLSLLVLASCVEPPSPWSPDGGRYGDAPHLDASCDATDVPSVDVIDLLDQTERDRADGGDGGAADGGDGGAADGGDGGAADGGDGGAADGGDGGDDTADVGQDADAAECQEACVLDTARCNLDGDVETCIEGEDGCLTWSVAEACPEATLCRCDEEEDSLCSPLVEACICIGTCGGECGTCSSDNPCVQSICDGETWTCTDEPLSDIPCNADDDGCTVGDSCQGGQCQPGAAADCTEFAGPCISVSCLSESATEFSCQTTSLPGETACDDGLVCTTDTVCDGEGACGGGQPLACDDVAGPCEIPDCVEGEGCVVAGNLDDGTPCDADSDGCTVADSCVAGACVPGLAADCSAFDAQCQVGECTNLTPDTYDCSPVPATPGGGCDDGDFCTVGETCDEAGLCGGGEPNTCGFQAGPCDVVICSTEEESCYFEPKEDGTVCQDDDPCTAQEECSAGQCVGTADLCGPHHLSTRENLVGHPPLAGPPALADLGYGRVVALWRGGDGKVISRFIDRESSLSHPELNRNGNWVPENSACETVVDNLAVAAADDGTWLAVTGYKWGTGFRTNGNMDCYATVNYAVGMAVYDRDGEVLQDHVKVGANAQLWQDHYHSSGGQIADYECSCDNYPDSFTAYLEITVPPLHDPTIQNGGVDAVAFADGSFGIVRWSESMGPYYFPVGQAHDVGGAIDLGEGLNVHACANEDGDAALVVWDDGAGAVYGRLLDQADGNTLGDPVPVSGNGLVTASRPTCQGLNDGSFMVSFDSCAGAGTCEPQLRLVDANGQPAGNVVAVANPNAGDQYAVAEPVVLTDGSFRVLWQDEVSDDCWWRSYAVAGSPNATGSGSRFTPEDAGNHHWPVGVATENKVFAAWGRGSGNNRQLLFRKVTADGDPVTKGQEQRANTYTLGDQSSPSGVALPDGGFLLVWESHQLPGGAGLDVAFRRFDAAGTPLDTEVMVNSEMDANQEHPRVAFHAESETVLVTWDHTTNAGDRDVRGRLLDLAGTPLGAEFTVNLVTQEEQYDSHPYFLPDGRFIVTYTGYTSPAYAEDIYLRVFDASGTPLAFADGEPGRVNYKRGVQEHHGDCALVATNPPALVCTLERADEETFEPQAVIVRKVTINETVDGITLTGDPGGNDYDVSLSNQPHAPAIAFDGNKVVLCWTSSQRVSCQTRSTANGLALQQEFDLETSGWASGLHLASPGPGQVVVTYDWSPTELGYRDVVVHRIDLGGAALSPAIIGSWTTVGHQRMGFSVPLVDGLLLGWASTGQDGLGGDGVYYRVLD